MGYDIMIDDKYKGNNTENNVPAKSNKMEKMK